jgi:Rieske Fe-S protein
MNLPPVALGADDRRGFLAKAVAVVCGVAACAVPAAAGLVAFLNPLRQKSAAGGFLRLASLEVLPEDGSPRKFPVFARRSDAWNSFPNQAVGAVFIRRVGAGQVEAIQVVCPHAGCFVAFDQQRNGFSCPCHAARFDISGKRLDPAGSPSPRDLDVLETEVRNGTEVWVKFESFRTGTPEKTAES